MSDMKAFYCLRCQARFAASVVARETVERSCPKCGSNSVRLETPISSAKNVGGAAAAPTKE